MLGLQGLLVLYGWYSGSSFLVQLHPTFVPMQFNTALGFLFLGLALFCLLHGRSGLTQFLAGLTVLMAGLTLLQYITGLNLGIDELFWRHQITLHTNSPGRMAPNTALCFLLSSLALWLLSQRHRFPLVLSGILGALVIGLGTVAIFGYWSGVESAYGWGKWTRMAVHTAGGLILVGLMLIGEEQYFGRKIGYRFPPLTWAMMVEIMGITVTLAFWQALGANDFGKTPASTQAFPWVTSGVLVFGLAFSLTLAIAVWFSGQFQAQLVALQTAQAEILSLNEQLEKLSYLDGLTGIANRRMFDLTAERELGHAYRRQYPLALIIFDLDCFKAYNDHYGHLQGDDCLQQVAQVIQGMARRPTDLAARYGGEEFVLLLPDATLSAAQRIAEKALREVDNLKLPHPTSGVSTVVTLSAGVTACVPQQQTGIKHLFKQADQALYQAKAQGRACVVALASSSLD
jgi:diguanylate cyclase (GGDEF)-like protein